MPCHGGVPLVGAGAAVDDDLRHLARALLFGRLRQVVGRVQGAELAAWLADLDLCGGELQRLSPLARDRWQRTCPLVAAATATPSSPERLVEGSTESLRRWRALCAADSSSMDCTERNRPPSQLCASPSQLESRSSTLAHSS